MPTTTYLGLTYPSLSDAPNVPQSMQTMAGNVDTKLGGVILCTSSTRPTAREGATIYETDTDRYARYTGSGWEYLMGSRQSYVPTLTAPTSPPSLGTTGSVKQGWYNYLPGPSIQYMFFLKFGTTGNATGNGTYQVSLPVNSALPFGSAVHSSLGSCLLADSSTGVLKVGVTFIDSADPTTVRMIVESSTPITSGAPWTWASGDYMSGSIIYPI